MKNKQPKQDEHNQNKRTKAGSSKKNKITAGRKRYFAVDNQNLSKKRHSIRYGRPLRLNMEFSHVFRSKDFSVSKHLVIYCAPTPAKALSNEYLSRNRFNCIRSDQPAFRYGITISSDIKGAVLRNHCKRRLRALLAPYAADLPAGLDLVLMGRKNCDQAEFAELQKEMKSLIKKAGLLNYAENAEHSSAAGQENIAEGRPGDKLSHGANEEI